MIISNSWSESEPDIGVYSVDKRKLSTVVDISVSQFDEFDFVFLTSFVLHLDMYQIFNLFLNLLIFTI